MKLYKNRDWLIKKYCVDKLSMKQIGDICGVSFHCVQRWITKYHIKPRSRSRSMRLRHSFNQPSYKNRKDLDDMYWGDGLSSNQMAKILKCSGRTILNYLKKYNITVRSNSEATHLRMGNHCNLSSKALEWIEGELLGDGCLMSRAKHSAYFTYTSKYNEYINYVSNKLYSFGIRRSGKITFKENVHLIIQGHPTYSKEAYQYNSKMYEELKFIYNKWYINHKKVIVPKDLKLTPLVCRQWYLGDGGLNNPKGSRSSIVLNTQCFTIDDNNWLVKQLNELEFKASRQHVRNTIHISVNSTQDFLTYIGKCPVECYNFKWDDYNKGFSKAYTKERDKKNRQYRKEHREEISLRSRQYNKEHKEEKNVYNIQYRQEHIEELKEYQRQNYRLHKEEKKAKQRQYSKEHKEERNEYNRQYWQKHKEEINARRRKG